MNRQVNRLKKVIVITSATIAVLAVAIIALAIWDVKTSPMPEETDAPDIDAELVFPDRYNIHDYTNSVRGHVERDTIVGNFYGMGQDTLYIVPASKRIIVDTNAICYLDNQKISEEKYYGEARFLFDIRSSRMMAPLRVFGLCPALVYEGDLDHDGVDEFGILNTWVTSNCRSYKIYTWHDYSWKLLVDPIFTTYELRASGLEIARPGTEKGTVLINKASDSACCNGGGIDRDTLYTATYIEIE